MITDLTYLETMSAGNEDLMKEMIDIFIEQVNELSTEMQHHMDENNWMALSKIAHKAKSSVAIMGMNNLAADLKQLELMAKDAKETNSYQDIVERFNTECGQAVEELKSLTNNH
ncbi:MAG TPA: Hpt domain-containing protein [Bacteroidales bacterium]|nr:Hpt domain-containing protein [Bacteroidales bacterium]